MDVGKRRGRERCGRNVEKRNSGTIVTPSKYYKFVKILDQDNSGNKR